MGVVSISLVEVTNATVLMSWVKVTSRTVQSAAALPAGTDQIGVPGSRKIVYEWPNDSMDVVLWSMMFE
jgi:hypothetical protein